MYNFWYLSSCAHALRMGLSSWTPFIASLSKKQFVAYRSCSRVWSSTFLINCPRKLLFCFEITHNYPWEIRMELVKLQTLEWQCQPPLGTYKHANSNSITLCLVDTVPSKNLPNQVLCGSRLAFFTCFHATCNSKSLTPFSSHLKVTSVVTEYKVLRATVYIESTYLDRSLRVSHL